jgi:multiple sugar transport system permease protein
MKRSLAKVLGFTLPWSLTFLMVWLFPLIYSLIMGFTDYNLLRPDEAKWVDWQNYTSLFDDPDFINSIKNTFIFVIGTIPATTIIALFMAMLVNRSFRGRAFFRSAFFLPSITSLVVIALIFTNLYQRGGYIAQLSSLMGLTVPEYGFLYDNGTALYSIMAMDVWMSCGYYMLIFLAGLKSIPDELYEAADSIGAGFWRKLFSITLPLLKPVTLFIVVINTIKSFQVFVEIFVMTKGKFDSMTMVYFIYEKGFTTSLQAGYASAAAYVLFAIIAVLSILQFFLLRRKEALW